MGRYAVFRTSNGYGPEADEPPGTPPAPGAILDGTFDAYGDPDERHHRWVVELVDLADLHALAAETGHELVFLVRNRYDSTDLLDGLDGIVEIYDAWRE